MSYPLQDIKDSEAIANKNNQGTTISVILLAKNEHVIFLSPCLSNIIGFRVKALSWLVTPASFTPGSTLQISSPELTENCINQSSFIATDSSILPSARIFRSPIIATWEFKKGVAPENLYLRREEQPIIWLQRPSYFNRISFKIFIDGDYQGISFDETNLMVLTIEFFYHVNTSK